MPKKVRVIEESESGLNKRFRDEATGKEMSRGEFVQQINSGNYPGYHVMVTNGLRIPRSNPDKFEGNNLE